ncbi:calcium/sodium antiporter [Candidatus Saccharibacteria bacterium]|nr:calcium/sodium antiporter [Candidatus Saccharibacteria bacterium]NIV03900.1 calcium/sodium antiporter [Calditrichia bacterium]NIS38463.1 calcium/sodium antiporter [Candidatus Saccharibacteria bacterium]NIV72231.1 calcium/sodium antiporter [Calditrichia bacterium]NIV99187.1 calcium/sodium antiporter [Candidatus Saccharibacteria bacterium]
MVWNLLILAAGLAVLIKGADFLIDGSSSIAKRLKIPYIVIGLVVVAFGTSLPELVVNILASAQGSTELAIANVVGSNISNILLILGISAIIFPLTLQTGTTWKEIPLSLLAILLIFIMANDVLFDGAARDALTRIDGIVLLCFFIIFIYYTYGVGKIKGQAEDGIRVYNTWIALAMILAGVAGLALGGKLAVDSAVKIAQMAGLSEAMIGLTIVAIGTSLPELAASAVAAYKRNPDIAIGNIIGSNIFNVFWVLGLSSVIRPLPFSTNLNIAVIFTIAVTIILFLFMFVGKRRILERWQGIGFVILYAAYLVYVVYQG